jgi:hypothetical protein
MTDEILQKTLLGRRIVAARYTTPQEQSEWGWFEKGIILQFDNGTIGIVQADEEGNDAGRMIIQEKERDIFL